MQETVQQEVTSEKGLTPNVNETTQSAKDVLSSKKKKRRRLKGWQPQSSDQVNEITLNADAENSNCGDIEDEENDPEELQHGPEDDRDNGEPTNDCNEAEEGFYLRDIEEHRQTPLMEMMSVATNRPTLLHEVGATQLPFVILLCTPIVLL